VTADHRWSAVGATFWNPTGTYPKGTKIPDREIKALETTGVLTRHTWHGEWNYTLNPENARVED
jgi:hypothetical protein